MRLLIFFLYGRGRCTNFVLKLKSNPMKRLVIYLTALVLVAGCAGTVDITRVQVTPLGQEPKESEAKFLYALPRSVLKVELTVREERSVPGPYWEYAERYLGLKEVVRTNSSRWSIWDVAIEGHSEMDPIHFYSLNVLEGNFDGSSLSPYLKQGTVLLGAETTHESAKGNLLQSTHKANYIRYEDLGVSDNFEERTETMYKTIVTDTAFVQVPVQRTVVEQKSPSTKAREAADFLLELRTRRFEMLTGEYEVYPDGEAMGAALLKLDQMEDAYLSLFTGKTITKIMKRTWFIVPRAGVSSSTYPLDNFSDLLGFVPENLMEGKPLEVLIEPLGLTQKAGDYFSIATVPGNSLIYRIPDVAELKIMLGEEALATHRISIYQSGHMTTGPIQ
jgi:hypothetical protein